MMPSACARLLARNLSIDEEIVMGKGLYLDSWHPFWVLAAILQNKLIQHDSTAIMQLWKSQLLNPVQDLWVHGATSLVILSQVFSRSIAVSTGEQVALSSGVCPYLFALAYPYSFIFAPRKPNLELSN